MQQYVRLVRRPAAVLCALAVGFTSLTMTSQGVTQTISSETRDASSWPLLGHDPQMSSFNPAEHTIGPASVARLHSSWSARYVYQAVATPTRVYAITQGPTADTRLLVLEARSGRVLHAYSAASLHVTGYPGSVQDTWFQSLAYAGDRLVVGATNDVIAIDPETGRVYWRVRGGAFGLTAQGGVVYTTKRQCQNPCGIAVDSAIALQTGRVLWKHRNGGQGPMLLAAGRLVQQDLSTLIGPPGPPSSMTRVPAGYSVHGPRVLEAST
jgi:hypothetical protein